jgi:hypothetical protein
MAGFARTWAVPSRAVLAYIRLNPSARRLPAMRPVTAAAAGSASSVMTRTVRQKPCPIDSLSPD